MHTNTCTSVPVHNWEVHRCLGYLPVGADAALPSLSPMPLPPPDLGGHACMCAQHA